MSTLLRPTNPGSPFAGLASVMWSFAVAGLVVAVYWPGLKGAFFFDDNFNILFVDAIRLRELSFDALRSAWSSGIAGPLGRPISQLSFALNYYFSGFDPFFFKLTNVLIHCVNGFLIYKIAVHVLSAARREEVAENPKVLASWLAIAWLLHPIQLTSVLYVVQRMTSLASFFALAGILLHISARERNRIRLAGVATLLGAWVIVWPLSLLTKESGVLFVGFVAAYELVIRRFQYRGFDRIGLLFLWGTVGAAIAGVGYLLSPLAEWVWHAYDERPFSLGERLLTEGRVIWFYISLLIFPRLEALGLYHDDIAISSSLLVPWTTIPAVVGVLALAVWAWWARARNPLLAFGILWFFVGHSLESTIIGLEIAHEHRNYLASFGLLLLPIAGLQSLGGLGTGRTAWIALLLGLTVHAVFITALRSHQFGNEVRRTLNEAQNHPNSARANYDAGVALVGQISPEAPNVNQGVLARKYFERANEADPSFTGGYLGLIYLSCMAGDRIEQSWIEELTRRLAETAISAGVRATVFVLKKFSTTQAFCLDGDDARRIFRALLSNPSVSTLDLAVFYGWYADYLILHEHALAESMSAMKKSLELVPESSSHRLRWAQLLYLNNRRDEARQVLKTIEPDSLSGSEQATFVEMTGLVNCPVEGENRCVVAPEN